MNPGRNARLSKARAVLHDLQCTSARGPDAYCTGDNEHARRTQHDWARRIVDGGMPALLDVLHEVACHPHCTSHHRPAPDHPKVQELARELGVESVSA